jgi:hypothetical protein
MRGTLAALLVSLAAAPRALAQGPTDSWQVHGALGATVYAGGFDEGGVGALLRADAERPWGIGLLRLEATVQAFTTMYTKCTTGVPGSCSPEMPPSTTLSLVAAATAPASGPFYLLAGVGAYDRAATPRHSALGDLGVEFGTGLRAGRRADVELRIASVGRHDRSGRYFTALVRLGF